MKRRGIGKTILIMIGLSIALGWAVILLIPTAIQMGMTPAAANKLPFLGFALGLVWGLCQHFSSSAKMALQYVGGILLLGAVFWFFAVLAGGLLVTFFGLSESAADYIPLAGFCLGVALGSVPMFAAGYDVFSELRARFAAKKRD